MNLAQILAFRLPIDTAPRDGSEILIYDEKPYADEPDIHPAFWDTDRNGGHGDWTAASGVPTDPFDIEPTHWFPWWRPGGPVPMTNEVRSTPPPAPQIGKRTFSGVVVIERSADPGWTVGDITWFEQRAALAPMRPLMNRRLRVIEREESGEAVTYRFEPAPLDPPPETKMESEFSSDGTE